MHSVAQSGTWGAPEWTAFAALGTFAVALIASGIALIQLWQAKALYREQVRPFVIVDFSFDGLLVSISVKNTGSTPAMNVSMTFDPPLRGEDFYDTANAPMFAKGIPMMAPGREMRVRLGQIRALHELGATSYKVIVTYSNLTGRRYADPPLYLDLGVYNQTEIERQPVVDSLTAIERAIQRMGGGRQPDWARTSGRRRSTGPAVASHEADSPGVGGRPEQEVDDGE